MSAEIITGLIAVIAMGIMWYSDAKSRNYERDRAQEDAGEFRYWIERLLEERNGGRPLTNEDFELLNESVFDISKIYSRPFHLIEQEKELGQSL